MHKAKIAIFASGSGSNAEKLLLHAYSYNTYEVAGVYTNKKNAGVIERLRTHGYKVEYLPSSHFECDPEALLLSLDKIGVDYIVLAGFLRKLHPEIIDQYKNKIINIHPSLLPRHGGKGMYGSHVHRAVLESGDEESGITIHIVTEEYDQGEHLLQARCSISSDENLHSLTQKIQKLEHFYFPRVVEYITTI